MLSKNLNINITLLLTMKKFKIDKNNSKLLLKVTYIIYIYIVAKYFENF